MAVLEILRGPVSFDGILRPSERPDALSVVEAAYDLTVDDAAWLGGMLGAMEPLFTRGLGVYGFFFRLSDDGKLEVDSPTFKNCPPDLFQALSLATSAADPREILGIFCNTTCQSTSQLARRLGLQSEAMRVLAQTIGVHDQLLITAADVDGYGVSFSVLASEITRFPARTASAMQRVARHVASAGRLRRALAQDARRHTLDGEAVLNERGTVLHAEGEAKERQHRTTLTEAVKLLLGNHARLRKSEPDKVLELWTALVDGRWSLVGSTDTDGKRFLVARRNQPELRDPAALSPEERHVAALVAFGQSPKLIAYELGLPPSTVSQRLKSALRKLGLRSRVELARVFGSAQRDG